MPALRNFVLASACALVVSGCHLAGSPHDGGGSTLALSEGAAPNAGIQGPANLVGTPSPIAAVGLPILAVAGGLWLISRRKRPTSRPDGE